MTVLGARRYFVRAMSGQGTVAGSGCSGPRRRTRTTTALASGLLGLSLVAAACGGGGDAAEGDGNVQLEFLWWGSDTRHAYTQELIDLYEERNPGVTIEGSFTGWDGYWDRLATSVAGGETPDVLQMESRYVGEYASRGSLLALDDHLDDGIDISDHDEETLVTGQLDGSTYALPTGVNARTLIADPQAFEDAGVEVPDDEAWSWEDMIRSAASVTEGSGGDVFGLQSIGGNDTNIEVFARQRGEALFNDDGSVGVSKETLVEFWTLAEQARESGAEPRPSLTVEVEAGGVDQSLLATNRGALGFWWTNELSAMSEASGRDLELLRFPGETTEQQPGMYLKPAMFWSIGADTEHPEEAAKFVDFLLNDAEAAEITLSDRGLPANISIRDQISGQLTEADQKSAAFVEEISPDLQPPPPVPPQGAGEVAAIAEQIHERLLFDQMTVEEAAEEFLSQVEAATS